MYAQLIFGLVVTRQLLRTLLNEADLQTDLLK